MKKKKSPQAKKFGRTPLCWVCARGVTGSWNETPCSPVQMRMPQPFPHVPVNQSWVPFIGRFWAACNKRRHCLSCNSIMLKTQACVISCSITLCYHWQCWYRGGAPVTPALAPCTHIIGLFLANGYKQMYSLLFSASTDFIHKTVVTMRIRSLESVHSAAIQGLEA